MFGRFLEFSLACPDVLESLRFYQRLGFAELPVNDMRRRKYAVVSDGTFCIGLHGEGLEAPALCFVRQDVAGFARDLEVSGHEPAYVHTGIEEFHELGLLDPAGNAVVIQEARTFSAWLDLEFQTQVGRVGSVCLPCAQADESVGFWQSGGLVLDEDIPDPPPVLRSGALALILDSFLQPAVSGLDLAVDDLDEALSNLAAADIDTLKTPTGPAVRAPEGTLLRLKTTDG